LLYINDIHNCAGEAEFVLYADDTTILTKARDPLALTEVTVQSLNHLNEWFKANRLSLNHKKTKFIHFSKNPKKFTIHINAIQIEQVDCFRFLGILIDEKLSWSSHVNMLKGRIARAIGILKRIYKLISKKERLLIYNAFINSHLSYCIEAWGSAGRVHMNVLAKLQKKPIGIVGSGLGAEYDHKLKKLNVLKLDRLHEFRLGTLLYECIMLGRPRVLASQLVSSAHVHDTRYSGEWNLRPIPCRTAFRLGSPLVLGGRLWRNVPAEIKLSRNKQLFKKRYRKHLMSDV
jgi:hypothetical protein